MRARSQIYHIDCFRCVACSRQLVPGDEYALRDDGLFCKADHEIVEKATATAQAAHVKNGQRTAGTRVGGECFPLGTAVGLLAFKLSSLIKLKSDNAISKLHLLYISNVRKPVCAVLLVNGVV